MKTHHLLLAVIALALLPGSLLAEVPTLREQSQQAVEARDLQATQPLGLLVALGRLASKRTIDGLEGTARGHLKGVADLRVAGAAEAQIQRLLLVTARL